MASEGFMCIYLHINMEATDTRETQSTLIKVMKLLWKTHNPDEVESWKCLPLCSILSIHDGNSGT